MSLQRELSSLIEHVGQKTQTSSGACIFSGAGLVCCSVGMERDMAIAGKEKCKTLTQDCEEEFANECPKTHSVGGLYSGSVHDQYQRGAKYAENSKRSLARWT
jgi:hypothetical protein